MQVVCGTDGKEYLGIPCCAGCGKITPGPYQVVRANEEHVAQWPIYRKMIDRYARKWFFIGWSIATAVLFLIIAVAALWESPPEFLEWLATDWRTVVTGSLFPLFIAAMIGWVPGALVSARREAAYAGHVLENMGIADVSHMQLTTDMSELGKGYRYYDRKVVLLLSNEKAPA
jgi:hypothetical protein